MTSRSQSWTEDETRIVVEMLTRIEDTRGEESLEIQKASKESTDQCLAIKELLSIQTRGTQNRGVISLRKSFEVRRHLRQIRFDEEGDRFKQDSRPITSLESTLQ